MKRFLFTTIVCLSSTFNVCYSQLSLRLTPIDSYFPAAGVESVSFCIGVMMEPHPRLNLTVEYKKDYSSVVGEPISKYENQMRNNSLYRTIRTEFSFSEIAYRSAFSFRGNDENSGYIASGIALRFNSGQTTYAEHQPVYLPAATTKKYTKLTVPLSLYIGHKRATDGFFTDFYFGINYNLGSANGWNNAEVDNLNLQNNLNQIGLRYGMAFNLNIISKKLLFNS